MIDVTFRGWSKKHKTWVYGYVEVYSPGIGIPKAVIHHFMDWGLNGTEEVDWYSVGQYTGIKDRNGVDIYTGDIVEQRTGNGLKPEIVLFKHGCFHAGYHSGSSTKRRPKLINNKLKVIGNMTFNPDLMNKK